MLQVMYENARYAFTETCLALTVFRGDLTAVTIALFIQLLLIKAFHWLSRVRKMVGAVVPIFLVCFRIYGPLLVGTTCRACCGAAVRM